MKIYITDTHEVRTVTLRSWQNGSWSPDLFQDLADDLPRAFPADDAAREAGADCTMSEEEYQETVEFWQAEIALYNNYDERSWFVENLDSEERAAEFARGIEYSLWAD